MLNGNKYVSYSEAFFPLLSPSWMARYQELKSVTCCRKIWYALHYWQHTHSKFNQGSPPCPSCACTSKSTCDPSKFDNSVHWRTLGINLAVQCLISPASQLVCQSEKLQFRSSAEMVTLSAPNHLPLPWMGWWQRMDGDDDLRSPGLLAHILYGMRKQISMHLPVGLT